MSSQRTSYLIIGGCGFLGHHIVSQLLDTHSAQIAVLDLRTDRNRFPGVQYFSGDITSPTSVQPVLQKFQPTVLIHTASPLALSEDRALFDHVNITGTQNLLSCAAQAGCVRAFVFTSSSSIVFDGHHAVSLADESYPVLRHPAQTSYYSHTKGVAEALVLAANRADGAGKMLTAAIRPAGIFGEGDSLLLPGLLRVYYTGRTRWQIGDNEGEWDATYVGNVAHAHLLAARALLHTHSLAVRPLDHEKIDGEAFFVTNDEPMPFWTLAREVWKEAGWTGSAEEAWVLPQNLGLFVSALLEWIYWIVFLGSREPLFKRSAVRQACTTRTFDIGKAKRRLGYMPLVSLREGIKRGVRWFEEEERKKAEGGAEGKKTK